jgi:endonuclease/exonuclease/phosphatase family metal-dependent hydrolase
MTVGKTLGGAFVATLIGVSGLAVPATANASTQWPSSPTGLRVVAVSRSSFTVTTRRAAGAKKYRVYVAAKRSYLAVNRLGHVKHSGLSGQPKVTLSGLRYTVAPYFYRVEALNGSKIKFSKAIGSIALLPGTPTNVVATSGSTGTFVSWSPEVASGFQIQASTDPAFPSTGTTKTYTTDAGDSEFTPTGLSQGTTYYFRVRALNGATASAYSTQTVTATATTTEQPVRVMTYNLLEASGDGRAEGGQHVAPWSQRLPKVVALVKKADPDVLTVQEAATFVGTDKRQVDSLAEALPGYKLAVTELAPGTKHALRTADYILYKSSAYKAIGDGNYWPIGNDRYAVYQVLQNTTSGAKFLMVGVHTVNPLGLKWDKAREAETKKMLEDATALNDSLNLPIVYAGDYNSDDASNHPLDGPGVVMKAAHLPDAYGAAPVRRNAQYNSSNQYMRTPPTGGNYIDHVYVTPGIGVASWSLAINLTHGRFVGVMASDHNPVVTNLLIPYVA